MSAAATLQDYIRVIAPVQAALYLARRAGKGKSAHAQIAARRVREAQAAALRQQWTDALRLAHEAKFHAAYLAN